MTPGTVVGGKYLLVRLLGQGAMGEVWAAVNGSTGGEVAIKLLTRPREDLRHRLLREARACGKLRHRNVIDVHDVGETDDGEPFLVMALLTGETLADLLDRQRRLDPQHAAQIARDIARALAAAHKAGIVHRDLKPANVFLHHEEGAEDVVVKVLDFGVSKELDHTDGFKTVAGATVGSPAYMSPEQARSARDLDHRTDLWSLGVVLFEMLTGKRPFDGDAHQVLAKVALGPIPLVTHCVRNADPAFGALVARCLERDRAKRIGSADELAAALDCFARPAPHAPPPSPVFPAATEPMEDEDGIMPTMRLNRDAVRAAIAAAAASPLSSMTPVVQPASASTAPAAAPPVAPTRAPGVSPRHSRRAAMFASGVVALVLLGVLAAATIRGRAPAPPAPAGGVGGSVFPPAAESPSPIEKTTLLPETPRPQPQPTAAPAETAPPPPATSATPAPKPPKAPAPRPRENDRRGI